MATGRLPDPNSAPVTAKGDLYTYSTVPAKLAVGNDGETLVADSSTSTGLRYNPQNALVNPVINGGFDIWQRGTSFTGGSTSANIGPDRWNTYRGAAGSTFSRQLTNDTTNLPNIQYCMRVQRDSGNTSTTAIIPFQDFENVNSTPFVGKTITISFYARKGANYSATSDLLNILVVTGTGTDQSQRGGYTNQTTILNQNATLTTTWQRFAYTCSVGATATQLGFQFNFNPTGTAGTNDWFELTGVQIDLGTYTASSAPSFRRSGGTLAGELAACQRYFERFANDGGATGSALAIGFTDTTTSGLFPLPFTEKRVTPTFTFSAASGFQVNTAAATAISSGRPSKKFVRIDTTGSGYTANVPANLRFVDSSTATIDISAEL